MAGDSAATIYCKACGRVNLPEFVFCPACGRRMAEPAGADPEEDRLLSKLQSYLDQRLKDAKSVEIEIAEAAATRISTWVKLFGLFAGIPLAILVATLAILGVNSFVELKNKEQAATQLVDGVAVQASNLKSQLDQYAPLKAELNSLTRRVNRLEDFTLVNPVGVPKETWNSFLNSLRAFEDYLQALGYTAAEIRTFRITVVNTPGWIFTLGNDTIEIGSSYAGSNDVLLEAYFLHVLKAQAKNMNLQSNIHDDELPWSLGIYFVCSFKNSPNFQYTKSEGLDLGKIESRHTGESLARSFWTLRQLIGAAAADKLLFTTLSNVQTNGENDIAEFSAEMQRQDARLFGSSHKAAIDRIAGNLPASISSK